MVRVVIGSVALLALLVVCNSAQAEQRWEYKMTDDKGKVVEEGTFRADGGKLFKKTKDNKVNHIGTYQEPKAGTVIMDVEEGELKGKTDLTLEIKNPPTYKGELTRPNGKKFHIVVIIK